MRDHTALLCRELKVIAVGAWCDLYAREVDMKILLRYRSYQPACTPIDSLALPPIVMSRAIIDPRTIQWRFTAATTTKISMARTVRDVTPPGVARRRGGGCQVIPRWRPLPTDGGLDARVCCASHVAGEAWLLLLCASSTKGSSRLARA